MDAGQETACPAWGESEGIMYPVDNEVRYHRGVNKDRTDRLLIYVSIMVPWALLSCPDRLAYEIKHPVPILKEPGIGSLYPFESERECHRPHWRVAIKCGRYPSGFI